MAKTRRLSSEKRRDSILKAARGVFAENGFRGTTTRALAEAAGVSEALLFQHFPTKEALYAAMLSTLFGDDQPDFNSYFGMMEPSTATLVTIIQQFYNMLIDPRGPADKAEIAVVRASDVSQSGGRRRICPPVQPENPLSPGRKARGVHQCRGRRRRP